MSMRGLRQLPAHDLIALFGNARIAYAYEFFGIPDAANIDSRELAFVGRAAKRRVHTFVAGRICAHAALAARGMDRPVLAPDERGVPRWPKEAPGSIAHTDQHAVAAVLADTRRYASVGLDVEAIGAISDDVIGTIFTSAERSQLETLDAEARNATATLMFSAKESFYKAQYWLTRAWVDFHDVAVSVDCGRVSLHPAKDRKIFSTLKWPLTVGHVTREHLILAAVLIDSVR